MLIAGLYGRGRTPKYMQAYDDDEPESDSFPSHHMSPTAVKVPITPTTNSWICGVCGTVNSDNIKFCSCGNPKDGIKYRNNPKASVQDIPMENPTPKKCPSCNKLIPSTEHKCPNCGAQF